MPQTPDATTLDHWLRTAMDAAAAAAAVHRAGAGRVTILGAESKGFSDFVSQVDRDSQDAALEIISSRHPDHLIMAEEAPPTISTATPSSPPLWR